jgi:hypothetical protein
MNNVNDWKEHLRAGDPLADGHRLSQTDAGRMRAAIVLAVPRRVPVRWALPAALAAMLVAMVSAGLWAIRQTPAQDADELARLRAPAAGSNASDLRRLEFSMPGGTRLIWIFNDSFEMR